MALLCPNCGGDTVEDLPGQEIHCLECGMFSDLRTGESRATRVDDPEQLVQSHMDPNENPQVSDRQAAGITSAVGSAFGQEVSVDAPPKGDQLTTTENGPGQAKRKAKK